MILKTKSVYKFKNMSMKYFLFLKIFRKQFYFYLKNLCQDRQVNYYQ